MCLQVSKKIMDIETAHPGNKERQATVALTEWRAYKGNKADVDALILALRKCKLESVIPDVERVTQEFTA